MRILKLVITILISSILVNNSFSSCKKAAFDERTAHIFVTDYHNAHFHKSLDSKRAMDMYEKYFTTKTTTVVNNHYSNAVEFKKHLLFFITNKVDKKSKILKIFLSKDSRDIFVKSIINYGNKKYLFFTFYALNQCNKITHFEEISQPLTKDSPNDVGYASS